jgi:hypothetical protein
LTHDSIIIQIQAIKKAKHRSKLEQILSVFDSSKVHEVDIDETSYPGEYRPIIRRLAKALANAELRETMNIEDDIIEEFTQQKHLVEKLARENREIKRLAEKECKEKEEAKRLAEKERKEKEEAKRKEKEALLKLAKMMKDSGKSTGEIARETGLTHDEIEDL